MEFNTVFKRSLLTALLFVITGFQLEGQVAVNTVTPGAGSISDFETTDKGILIPRVNIADLSTIAPITGGSTESLLVYNTNTSTGKGYYYWDGSSWVGFSGGGAGNDDWKLLGNATTDPSTNFIGTTDNQPFVNRTNGIEYMRLLTDGSLGLNTSTTGNGSLLDVDSSNKALLIPRVNITDLSTIAPITGGSTEGLLVYNTNLLTGKGFHYWDGSDWILLGTNVNSGNDWTITGNLGTNIATNFLGTTDDQDYIFRTNGIERMRLTYEIATGDARLGIGTSDPDNTVDVNGDIEVGGETVRWDHQGENIFIRPDSNTWYTSVDNDLTVADSEFFIADTADPNDKVINIDPITGYMSIGPDDDTPDDILHMTENLRGFNTLRIDNDNNGVANTVHTSLELWAGASQKSYFQYKNADDILEIGHTDATGQIDFYLGAGKVMNFTSGNVTVLGDLDVGGNISKGSGTFKIDHPLYPEEKYLYHSFVESPDMMNIYDGIITTDEKGNAVIELPSYFNALNKDFQYQFTPIGSFSKVMVTKEISENTFEIRSQKPNVKISWQVTGIRKDPYANKYRVIPEVEKETQNKGTYLYPKGYNDRNAIN